MGRTKSKGTWSAKGVRCAVTVLAAVLALPGCAQAGGDGGDRDTPGKAGSSAAASPDPKPSESYAAPAAGGLDRAGAVGCASAGKRTDEHGSEVGFPHTTEGAVAALAASSNNTIEGNTSHVDEQLRLYYSYVAKADQSEAAAERVELGSIDNGKAISREMGLKPGAPMPPGAYMRSQVIGYQVIKKSDGEVSAWLLSRVTQKAGETVQERDDYARLLFGAKWEGDDWKLSVLATRHAQDATDGKPRPKIVAPGDAAFNSAGWTAIRQAS